MLAHGPGTTVDLHARPAVRAATQVALLAHHDRVQRPTDELGDGRSQEHPSVAGRVGAGPTHLDRGHVATYACAGTRSRATSSASRR